MVCCVGFLFDGFHRFFPFQKSQLSRRRFHFTLWVKMPFMWCIHMFSHLVFVFSQHPYSHISNRAEIVQANRLPCSRNDNEVIFFRSLLSYLCMLWLCYILSSNCRRDLIRYSLGKSLRHFIQHVGVSHSWVRVHSAWKHFRSKPQIMFMFKRRHTFSVHERARAAHTTF